RSCGPRGRGGPGGRWPGGERMTAGTVTFVGAGPGAPDLLTLRGAAAIAAADVVIWASSLVHPDVLEHARPGAEIVDSAQLPLEGVAELYQRPLAEDLTLAPIHSGDPALWRPVAEQRELCPRLRLVPGTMPGVSACAAVAVGAGAGLGVREVDQSVLLTGAGGGKRQTPAGGKLAEVARRGPSMAVFLSAARYGQLQAELVAGGCQADAPVVVASQ